jgi:hypothetical protein
MDPYRDREGITRSIQAEIQRKQWDRRQTDIERRTDIYADEAGRRGVEWEAGMYDRYGYRGEGAPPAPHTPDESQAGGSGQETAGLPGAPTPGMNPMHRTPGINGEAPLGAVGPGGNPMHREPQFSPGDVRNEQVIAERIALLGGGSIAPIGQRPQEQYQAGQRREMGGMLMDYYGPMLGLDESARPIMEETGGMPPVMKPHQTAGYGSAEGMAEDAYALNRVEPSVLSALIRAGSAEGGGGMTAQRQNDILTNQFADSVSAYIRSAREAGQEVSVEDAYFAVKMSDPAFAGVNISLPEFSRLYPNVYTAGGYGAISPFETGEGMAADPMITGLVLEAQMSATPAATIERIRNTHGEAIANQVATQLDIIRRVQLMQRFGAGMPYTSEY